MLLTLPPLARTTPRIRAELCAAEPAAERYAKFHNDYPPQRSLGHRALRQEMAPWSPGRPDFFVRKLNDQAGLDRAASPVDS